MVSADRSAAPSAVPPAVAGRAHRAVEPLHNHVYFAPETEQHLTAAGLGGGRGWWFAGRPAPMGAVGPGVVTATFYNFAPALVARHVPRAWGLASPEQVVAARLDAARASLTRLLGDAATGPEVAELAGLLRTACAGLTPEGRPLYAGHADLPWPEDDLGAVWHAATLLREWRGDGHIAALVRSGLSGLEALVTHTLTGRGFTVEAAKATRGWGDEAWAAAEAALTDRGLVDATGLTAEGHALREQLEEETDLLDTVAWRPLGAEQVARVVELGKGLSRRLVEAGAYATSGLAGGR
jgi:hypothetical protein